MATKLRSIRVDDVTWSQWEEAADAEHTSVSEWIRDAATQKLGAGSSKKVKSTAEAEDAVEPHPGPAPTIPPPSPGPPPPQVGLDPTLRSASLKNFKPDPKPAGKKKR